MNLALELAIHLAQVIGLLLARLDLHGAVDRDGEMDLGLVEAAQIELVDDAAVVLVVDRIAGDELGRGHDAGRRLSCRCRCVQIEMARTRVRAAYGRLGRRHRRRRRRRDEIARVVVVVSMLELLLLVAVSS